MAARFYVYALIDPRDGSTFYVGKGSGNRKSRHAANVRRGSWDCNGPKCERIAAILAAGLAPEEKTLHSNLSEIEAFRIERELIASTSGLLNISGGNISSAEAAAARARHGLALFKTYEEWLATAGAKRFDAAVQVSGSPRKAYDTVRGYLLELAEAA